MSTKSSIVESNGGDGVVLPVYSNVMILLALIYLFDAVVWFIPPFLNLSGKDSYVFPILKIVKAAIGSRN